MMRALGIAAFSTACGAAKPIEPPRSGALEGTVTDPKTGTKLAGIQIIVGGSCRYGAGFAYGMTDGNGHYRIELAPGDCEVMARFSQPKRFRIEARKTAIADLDVVIDDVIADSVPRLNCPSSPPNKVIEGRRASQADVDAVARAALERFIADRSAIPNGDFLHGSELPVQIDVYGIDRALTTNALPVDYPARRFVLRNTAGVRAGKPVELIRFGRIYSDGTCALIDISVAMCSATDVYEKRDGRWRFVRSIGTSCA